MNKIDKHYYYLYNILTDTFRDTQIAPYLVFKGGTALMFFYDLPRFSIDLDFTLIDKSKETIVYERIEAIVSQYGKLHDTNLGSFGPKVVLNYGLGEWNLKVEVSNRYWGEQHDIFSLGGVSINVMRIEDMYANKLVALIERDGVANRDIFDIYFFEKNMVSPNEEIIQNRRGVSLSGHLEEAISLLKSYPNTRILSGLGDLLEPTDKLWVKNNLLKETINKLEVRLLLATKKSKRARPRKKGIGL